MVAAEQPGFDREMHLQVVDCEQAHFGRVDGIFTHDNSIFCNVKILYPIPQGVIRFGTGQFHRINKVYEL
jgi:hypothetical protein